MPKIILLIWLESGFNNTINVIKEENVDSVLCDYQGKLNKCILNIKMRIDKFYFL